MDSSRSSRWAPAVSIAVSSVASVKRRRRPRLLLEGLHPRDALRLAGGEVRRQLGLVPPVAVARLALRPGRARGGRLEGLPPRLLNRRARAVEAVHARRGAAIHPRDHGRHGENVLVVPRHQQPAADEVVDEALVAGEVHPDRGNGGREEGVVVGHLGVVHEATAERALAGPRGEERRVGPGDRRHHRRQGGGHVAGQVPAVGPRVGEELPGLVERLRGGQRRLRRESTNAVRVPLQLGEVVEKRRGDPARLLLDRLHLRASRPHAPDDLTRLDPVLRQAPGLRGRPVTAEPRAAVGRRHRLRDRAERGRHLEVVLGHEGAYRLLALDQEGQGRGLDPPDREELAMRERRRPGEVHPH